MTLEEKKQQIVEDFSMYDEWLDKYEFLIEQGKNLDVFPEESKTEDKLIKGCQSRVWLDCEKKDGKLFFKADSDAIITKGIISLLIYVYSGRTPEEIANDDFGFLDQIGLKENLSPTRAGGLAAMVETIKLKAVEAMAEASAGAPEQPQAAPEPEVLSADDVKELAPLYENVVLALKQVYDPEIPVNIYDLGLIYEININKEHRVYIRMTFTAPNCPMADMVISEAKTSVEDVPGVSGCDIDLVFEPAWNTTMMTDEARVALNMDIDIEDDSQE